MIPASDLRQRARTQHAAALATAGGADSATSLIAAAAVLTGLPCAPVRAGDSLLDGGEAQLDVDAQTIWYNADADPLLIPFYQAHEFAHHWLGHRPRACTASDLDAETADEPIPMGVQRVEGYGPHERREREANIFAREFLLPAPVLRGWFLDDGLSASAIADRVGLAEGPVLHQLAAALLSIESAVPPNDRTSRDDPPGLDSSQREAAWIDRGPVLVEAGPGTGKTRTLVARIDHLLAAGVEPSSILALTFSNKAAEEMRGRVAGSAPDAAPHIWMGTFHAFGLELLRKFGTRLGLPPAPRVLDPVEAFALLERELPALALVHYQNLYEPTTYLRDILTAISRAKDELAGPVAYAELADRMASESATDDEREAASKAQEVARVYAHYQAILLREGWLDFGDLLARAAELLQAHPEVRAEIRRTFAHVLVDEYQDVNLASGVLLREIASPDGLWVVGDVRQAIYRFRGAAPGNLRRLADDYPTLRRIALARNYRSRPEIVDAVSAFVPTMRGATAGFTPWETHRAPGGAVRMEIAPDLPAEILGLARTMEELRRAGIPFRDQAVLCRSHTMLARIANGLEEADIPVLYLGDLFERPEIRDLLALIELACGGDRGLVRVARFPGYQIPLADVIVLRARARELEIPFPRALELALEMDALSERGRTGLTRLQADLDGLCYGTSAWGLLARYLFERSDYVHSLLQDGAVGGLQRRLAVFQFLQFVHARRTDEVDEGTDPKRSLLRYVRRLEIYGEEKPLRQVPAWAAGLDAVRLSTVHASKGLEFRAVFLPALGAGMFPGKPQYQPCPPPIGLLADPTDADGDEEECLFFVALSRARDILCLSRAQSYGKNRSNPSPLLLCLEGRLPHPPAGRITWPAAERPAESELPLAAEVSDVVFDAEELDEYLACPRRYYYERVLEFGGQREDAAYVQFHRCVYAVVRWLGDSRGRGEPPKPEDALAQLAAIWADQGPVGHAYETPYWEQAAAMVEFAVAHGTGRSGGTPPSLEVQLQHGSVRITPDQFDPPDAAGTAVVRRLRTGRPPKKEDDDIYSLYHAAARQASGSSVVETLYLATGEVRLSEMSSKMQQSRLDKYDGAILGIGRGIYPANPNDRDCPRCPHYFVCPLAEDA